MVVREEEKRRCGGCGCGIGVAGDDVGDDVGDDAEAMRSGDDARAAAKEGRRPHFCSIDRARKERAWINVCGQERWAGEEGARKHLPSLAALLHRFCVSPAPSPGAVTCREGACDQPERAEWR